MGEARLDFSFSGLKTAVRQAADRSRAARRPGRRRHLRLVPGGGRRRRGRPRRRGARALPRATFPDVAEPALVVAGGVAANRAIRASARGADGARTASAFVAPPPALCTDNAAMIAWAGLERLRAGLAGDDAMAIAPRSRWPLDDDRRAADRLGPPGSQGMSAVTRRRARRRRLGHARSRSTACRAGHAVRLWARDARDRRRDQRAAREPALSAGHDARRRHRRHHRPRRRRWTAPSCVLVVMPAQAMREVLGRAGAGVCRPARRSCSAPRASSATPAACCREIAGEFWPDSPVAALSGPSFATDVARGLPTAVIVAARQAELARRARRALVGAAFPLLFLRRPDRRRDRRRAEERARHRRRRGRRRRPRRQRAGGHGHARLRRAAPHRRRLRRPAGDADGPVGPRRPGADLRLGASRATSPMAWRSGKRRGPGRPAAGRRRRHRRRSPPASPASTASRRRSSTPSTASWPAASPSAKPSPS